MKIPFSALAIILSLMCLYKHQAPTRVNPLLQRHKQMVPLQGLNRTFTSFCPLEIGVSEMIAPSARAELLNWLGRLNDMMGCALHVAGFGSRLVVMQANRSSWKSSEGPHWTRWTDDPTVYTGRTTHHLVAQVMSHALHEIASRGQAAGFRLSGQPNTDQYLKLLSSCNRRVPLRACHEDTGFALLLLCIQRAYKSAAGRPTTYHELEYTETTRLIEHVVADTLESVHNLWLDTDDSAPVDHYPVSDSATTDMSMRMHDLVDLATETLSIADGRVLALEPAHKQVVRLYDGSMLKFLASGSLHYNSTEIHRTLQQVGVGPQVYNVTRIPTDDWPDKEEVCLAGSRICRMLPVAKFTHVMHMSVLAGERLDKFLHRHRHSRMSTRMAKRMVGKMRELIATLRSVGLVHADAHAGHWLLMPTGDLQLIDFDNMDTASDLCVDGHIPEISELLASRMFGQPVQRLSPALYHELRALLEECPINPAGCSLGLI